MATNQQTHSDRGRLRVTGFESEAASDRQDLSSWEPKLQSREARSRAYYAWQRFKSNRLALFGAGIIAVLTLVTVFARPWGLPGGIPVIGGTQVQPISLAPFPPSSTDILNGHAAPNTQHLFGTDQLGRDIFSRTIYGGRWSLSIGFIAVSVALIIGIPLGAIAGYYGGYVDEFIMRIVDMLYAFPFIVLAIAVITIAGQGYWELVFALVVVGWLPYARLIRGEILSVKENEYVTAAKALGATDRSIITRHMLPNAMAPVIVQATLSVGSVVLIAAALSFLGLGLPPGTAEWGAMLQAEQSAISTGVWWSSVAPGSALFLFVLAINLVGDGIQDAFDPQGDTEGSGGLR